MVIGFVSILAWAVVNWRILILVIQTTPVQTVSSAVCLGTKLTFLSFDFE